MTRKALVAFDTDRIKEYVFGVDPLREIRGASGLLDGLNREVTEQDMGPGTEKVYANGGAALFVVEDADRAEEACRRVANRYREQTAGAASVTGAVQPLDAGEDAPTASWREPFRRLMLALRRAKDRPPEARALTSLPHLRPCDLCGLFPAALPREREADRLVCEACRRRWEGGKELGRRLGLAPVDPWDRLRGLTGLQGKRPDEFSEIARHSRPERYLALLYADGNRMGQLLQLLDRRDEFTRFAQGVDDALFEATADAVKAHLPPSPDGAFPFDVLLVGGDDLVMVMRAQSALDAAITLVERFTEHAERARPTQADRPVTLSAGVVLAPFKFPFRLMLELGESTLKFAKREAARRNEKQGLINFLLVTSANHADFADYHREQLVWDPPGKPTQYRTCRPYTAGEMRRLLEAARALHAAPRNKLHALGECLFQPYERSVLDALTVLTRWRGGAESGPRLEQVQTLRRLVSPQGRIEDVFPWRQDVTDWRSPLLDLVEVFDFVEGV